ncbi:SRPBCC family protein [Amycolatopsis sp., V23-08]|uniref:SRPBCC family protein n=1 Tax=Amycolatopsis heterodermiae TaxID=3110235 RepID=A0ABU5RDI0_9PSEU|nr:SRPBCC family protein [Amycolatopsis sp., V23-08]MEA5364320.1 SRPBCC family protein [Amycolatopsis sp., V23-08]
MSTTITAQPGTPFIEVVREFAAPPAAVFRAHREPGLVQQWLGPADLEMEIFEYDVRSGGSYRYAHRAERGEFFFRGVFHSVFHSDEDGGRIVQTFEFEGAPGEVSLDTTTFTGLGDGRTRMRTHSVFPSVEARDAAIANGMEGGITESYDRLDTLLEKES